MRPAASNLIRFVLRGAALSICLFASSVTAQVGPGNALHFDGTNGYVSIAHTSAFNAYPLTVTAWFRTTNTTLTRGIAEKIVDGVGDGWALIVQGGRLRGFFYRAGFANVAIDATSAGTVSDGRWHHAALAVNASGGKLFLDGVQIAASAWAGTAGTPTTTAALQIGRYYTYTERFDGDIDEVSVWNQALDGNSVNYVKHRRLAGNTDGLVGLWHLDEGAGTSTSNAFAGGFGGTLISSPAWVSSTAPIALDPVASNALKIDGANGYVQVSHNTNLNAYPFTATAWFRSTNTVSFVQGIVSKYPESSGNGWSLFVQNGKLRGFYYRPGFIQAIDATSVATVADGFWHHAALVVDNSGGKLLLDGNVVGTGTWASPGPCTNTEPVYIGRYHNYTERFHGALDEITLWNRALTTNEIQLGKNLPLVGNETGLLAYWRLNEGIGTTTADATGHGYDGTLFNNPLWVGSLARLGDGSQHVLANADGADFTRLWAVKTSPTVNAFPVSAKATMRRFHDFGAAPAPMNIVATLSAELTDNAAQVATLVVPAQTNLTFNLVSENANAPATNSVTNLIATININPVQLASAASTYSTTVSLAHSENGGAVNLDGSVTSSRAKLLDFSGALFFGTTETRFSSLANVPSPGLIGGGAVQSVLLINNNSGYLLAKPSYHFGNGVNLVNVNLFDDGHAIVTSGTLAVTGPVPDREVYNGITFDRVGLTISPANGTRASVVLRYPVGFSTTTGGISNRITSPTSTFANTLLDDLLIPQAPTLTVAGPIYGAEETKPFWIRCTSLAWNLAAGELTLNPPLAITYVRQQEDDSLNTLRPTLVDQNSADRISNDGYFHNIKNANGFEGAIVRADANGAALLSVKAALLATELRPHFPYTSRNTSGHIPVTGGQLVITNDLVDEAASYLLLGGPVPVSYARDCADKSCSNLVQVGNTTLQFTTDTGQLQFTRDGGLLGHGTVPPQNLTWGFLDGTNFAQRTSDVEAGMFHMPGTFLRADQTTFASEFRPAVILFSGFGDDANASYLERPDQPAYEIGLANYAGLNFRGPALGHSVLAGRSTGWYPLVPQAKYYARFSGISGIHQAATFPSSMTLYGYAFTFTRYALSYRDSENIKSLTDGAISFPEQPAGFVQEFKGMKFLCRGGMDSADVPPGLPAKHLAYCGIL